MAPAVRAVSITKHGVEVQILDVDPSLDDAQIIYEAAMYGCVADPVVYSPYALGDAAPPACDPPRITTLVELANALRTEPDE